MSTSDRYAYLGTDLCVIAAGPGFGAHDAAVLDLRSRPTPSQRLTRPSQTGPQGGAPEPPGARELTDLTTLTGRENLAQALTLRLLTPKGALTALGHTAYGSRLSELIGREKNDALRGLCRAYILEAIREEPRVENKPLAITFDPLQEQPSTFVVEIAVNPVAGGDAVTLGLEVAL